MLITYDRDFGNLLVADGETAPAGMIYLRLPRLAFERTLDRLRKLLKSDQEIRGQSVVVAPAVERWRALGAEV